MVSLQIQWQLIHHCKECSGTRWCRHEIHTTSHDITLQPASTGRVSTNTIKTPKPLPHPGHSPQHRPLAAPAKHKENCHVTVANAKSASQNMTCWCLWCNTGSSFFCVVSLLVLVVVLIVEVVVTAVPFAVVIVSTDCWCLSLLFLRYLYARYWSNPAFLQHLPHYFCGPWWHDSPFF